MSPRAWISGILASAVLYGAASGLWSLWQSATRGDLPVLHLQAQR